MSKKEEKKMRDRLQSDRSAAQTRYDTITKDQAPERAASNERYGERYGELQKGFGNFAETGGIDPTEAGRLRAGYAGFADTGGFDPSTQSNLKNFYGGMMSSGGYTPQDISNIRGRGNAGIPAVYSRLKENLANTMRRTGGSQAGYGATLAKLGRQSAQDAATTARDTEVDIADRLRQGKLTGAAGQFGLENAIRSGKLQGLSGGQGLEESLRSGKSFGLQGLGGLASNDLAQTQQFDKNRFLAAGGIDAANQGTYGADLSLATRPGWGSNLMKGLGVAASFASPFLGGFGGMLGGLGGAPLGGVPDVPVPSFEPPNFAGIGSPY